MLLIINNRKKAEELRLKLQKSSTLNIEVADKPKQAREKAFLFEPDLIIIPPAFDDIDSFALIQEIRKQISITRPVIVMLSHDQKYNSSDSIKAIQSGADDYMVTSMPEEELSARIFAHLRRNVEQLSDSDTRLPGYKLINTVLKRKMNFQQKWALLVMSLQNIRYYEDTYGELAANQLLKAFVAIINANTSYHDFIGHLGNEDFVVITNPLKAEVVAGLICKTFDAIVPKFYAPYEADRGYSIHSSEGKASIKVPLVAVNIGIVSNMYRNLTDFKTALSIANNMKDLAKHQLYSGWLIDRPLLVGDEIQETKKEAAYIIIVEPDAALAYLLTTTLEMQGYNVDATSNREEAIRLISTNKPDLVLIDAAIPGEEGWEVCTFIKSQEHLKSIKIIMATVIHDKEKAFAAGADLYIPKPYELISLHRWINRLITGES